MIDSGAFSKHNAKSSDMSHVNVDEYCKFCEIVEPYCEKYVMLDVVGNAAQSRFNYETMIKRGFNPMYVMTLFDKDYNFLREAVKNNPHLCVAGGVTTKGTWMTKRFQTIYKESNNKALIHGLGYVTFPKMLQLPLYSVDSSSWNAQPARFGEIVYFDNGIKGIVGKMFFLGKKRVPDKLQEELCELRVTPTMFFNKKLHRGAESIGVLASIYANIVMQRYCKRHGLDYFLAVGNVKQLEQIVYVDTNIKDLNYQKFRKEFGK